jgi:hypothetical protein
LKYIGRGFTYTAALVVVVMARLAVVAAEDVGGHGVLGGAQGVGDGDGDDGGEDDGSELHDEGC